MGKWSIETEGTPPEFFLTLLGKRAINPIDKKPFSSIDKIVCGRTAEELVLKFKNAKQGRHLSRLNFDSSTEIGAKLIHNQSNRLFIISFDRLTGKDVQNENPPKTKGKQKVQKETFIQETDSVGSPPMLVISAEKFLGEVTIPKSKLVEPPYEMLLRPVRDEWVLDLEKHLLQSQQQGTMLNKIIPVMVDSEQVTSKEDFDMEEKDSYRYFTLGGNHLRNALNKVDNISHVTCNVYINLSEEEGLRIAAYDNQMQSLTFTFQDKIRLARRFHLRDTDSNTQSLSSKMKLILGSIEMREIKDSISTVLSVARYQADNFNLFEQLVEQYELAKGPSCSIPQKLFRLLQAENADTRRQYLSNAIYEGIDKATAQLQSSKKENALKRVFVEQTGVEDWEAAQSAYPNHTSRLKNFNEIPTTKYVPAKVMKFCKTAKENDDELEMTVQIKINKGGEDISEQYKDILKRHSNQILSEIKNEQ